MLGVRSEGGRSHHCVKRKPERMRCGRGGAYNSDEAQFSMTCGTPLGRVTSGTGVPGHGHGKSDRRIWNGRLGNNGGVYTVGLSHDGRQGGAMGGDGGFVRLGSVMATIIVAMLAIVSFGFLRQSANAQEQSLLQSDNSQLALVLNQAIASVGSSLSTLADVMAATHDSPSLFQSQASLITVNPSSSVAVADSVAGQFTVDLAAGPDFGVGQTLPAPLATAAASAGPKLSSTKVFDVGDKTFLGFLVGSTPGPQGTLVIGLTRITPSVPSKSQTGPYSELYVSVYASETADPAQLISGSLGSRPLPGPVARTFTTVGSSRWLTLASAKHPLAGNASRVAPLIVLAAGLIIALLIGVTSEILARRRRYAEELVEERTLELTTAQAALVRRERLSAVGEMATVIGHELRN